MLRIREILKSRKISIVDFAKMCDVSRNTVTTQIDGNPTVETLEKWATVLNVEITDLFVQNKNTIVCPHCRNTIDIEVS